MRKCAIFGQIFNSLSRKDKELPLVRMDIYQAQQEAYAAPTKFASLSFPGEYVLYSSIHQGVDEDIRSDIYKLLDANPRNMNSCSVMNLWSSSILNSFGKLAQDVLIFHISRALLFGFQSESDSKIDDMVHINFLYSSMFPKRKRRGQKR